MGRSIDITGVRSGKLTAIERSDKKKRGCTLWKCRCDCGSNIYLEPYKITRQITKSCGCSRKRQGMKDITGRQFGRLTACFRTNEKKGSSYLWHCRCDCGNEVEVTVSALLAGKISSCGCARRDEMKSRAKDISGRTFGFLTAIEPTEHRYHGGVVWKCQCKCGNEAEIAYNDLVTGNISSCGCKRKMHAQPPLHYVDGTCIEMIDHRCLRSDNTSGCTGVMAGTDGRWIAVITFKGKTHNLGRFHDFNEAVQARKRAEDRIFGEFLDEYKGKMNQKEDSKKKEMISNA